MVWGYQRTLQRRWLRNKIRDQHNRCAICGVLMAPLCENREMPTSPTLDHVIPLSKGGRDHWENVQAAHRSCNQAKGNALSDDIKPKAT